MLFLLSYSPMSSSQDGILIQGNWSIINTHRQLPLKISQRRAISEAWLLHWKYACAVLGSSLPSPVIKNLLSLDSASRCSGKEPARRRPYTRKRRKLSLLKCFLFSIWWNRNLPIKSRVIQLMKSFFILLLTLQISSSGWNIKLNNRTAYGEHCS